MENEQIKELAVVLICAVLLTASASLVNKPVDTEVMVNHSTYLNCSTSDPTKDIHWYHYPVGRESRDFEYVYAYGRLYPPYDNRFRIEKGYSQSAHNLVVTQVTIGDAGRYVCQDSEGVGELTSAELIILESFPVCETNIKPDGFIGPNNCGIEIEKLHMSCSLQYIGNIPPAITWTRMKEDVKDWNSTSACSVADMRITCNVSMETDANMDGSSFICQTTRSVKTQYMCKTDVAKVLYATGDKSRVEKTIDEDAFCSAKSNALCKYNWKWFDGVTEKSISDDQNLKLKTTGWHRCEASCNLKDNSCTFEAMVIKATTAPSLERIWKTTAIVAIVAAVVFLVPCIFLISLRVWAYISSNKDETENAEAAVPNNSDIRGTVKVFDISQKKREKSTATDDGYSDSDVETLFMEEFDDKYGSDPVLVHKIETKASKEENKRIRGLTILNKELFVVSGKCSKVEVYDSTKFSFSRQWSLEELVNPVDIVSCNRNKCLYIADFKYSGKSKEIIRCDPNGKLIKKWETDDGLLNLSVTAESNVILTLYDKNKLNEYSPDGNLIREIKLSSEEGIFHSCHAIKLNDGHFVVIQGSFGDPLHRVCLVDVDGNVKKLFGGESGSSRKQLNCPTYVSVDKDGFVFVADLRNRRVLLLDSNLEIKRIILSKKKKVPTATLR